MKDKGYQVIKGRGISFIDDRKVKVKGSELNYSLATIERILEKQRMLQVIGRPEIPALQKEHAAYSSNNQSSPLKAEMHVNIKPMQELQKDLSNMIEQVVNPEQMINYTSQELLKPRKRKKKKSLHL